ncbi:MAG: right-handed parallel beta-helix repeat-containing protein [Pirellulales bacterium]
MSAQPAVDVAAELFVDDDNGGPQDGSARHPFKTVQQAVDAATDNAVVAVAGGTYPQNIRIQDKSVRLYGGYQGATAADYAAGNAGHFTVRDPGTNPSHLKGDGKDSVVTMFDAGSSVVDGFLVTGGGRSTTAAPSWLGGGFYVYQGSPTISNNVIEKNQTCPPVAQQEEKLGGGIYATGSGVSILNNVIRHNVSGRGAGIAADGPKLVIRGNTVQSNIGVSDHGGGIYIFSPDAEVSHNRIKGNEIGRALGYGWGGGIVVLNQGGSYKLSHNIFTGNFAPSVGSAIFVDDGAVASSDHDLVFANACNPAGEGAVPPIYVDGLGDGVVSTLKINHATIADHACPGSSNGCAVSVTGGSKATVTNSILWNNGAGDVQTDETSKATVTFTLAAQKLKGTGNLSQDPLFADPAGRDYRLRSTIGRWKPAADGDQGEWVIDDQHSPAVDAADPQAPFDLEPNPNGGRADLGAFGNTPQASKSGS